MKLIRSLSVFFCKNDIPAYEVIADHYYDLCNKLADECVYAYYTDQQEYSQDFYVHCCKPSPCELQKFSEEGSEIRAFGMEHIYFVDEVCEYHSCGDGYYIADVHVDIQQFIQECKSCKVQQCSQTPGDQISYSLSEFRCSSAGITGDDFH